MNKERIRYADADPRNLARGIFLVGSFTAFLTILGLYACDIKQSKVNTVIPTPTRTPFSGPRIF